MRQNFIIDVLSSGVNAYRQLLPAEIKNYLSCIDRWNIKYNLLYICLYISWLRDNDAPMNLIYLRFVEHIICL
jgi:hypothetical protein